jgi:hypothetical protein
MLVEWVGAVAKSGNNAAGAGGTASDESVHVNKPLSDAPSRSNTHRPPHVMHLVLPHRDLPLVSSPHFAFHISPEIE